jgi:hypothetical protein
MQFAGRTVYVGVRLEQQVPTATARFMFACQWQVGAGVPPLRFRMLQVAIYYAELLSGRHTNQCVRPMRPPAVDNLEVGAGVLEAARR